MAFLYYRGFAWWLCEVGLIIRKDIHTHPTALLAKRHLDLLRSSSSIQSSLARSSRPEPTLAHSQFRWAIRVRRSGGQFQAVKATTAEGQTVGGETVAGSEWLI